MKAKRLTALALAALMAASTTSVALAAPGDVDKDQALNFYAGAVGDDLYMMDEDGYIRAAVDGDFAPGDDIYLALKEYPSASSTELKRMNVYADWAVGKSWVDDVDIVYKKGQWKTDVAKDKNYITSGFSAPYDDLNGVAFTSNKTEAASLKEAAIAALKSDAAASNRANAAADVLATYDHKTSGYLYKDNYYEDKNGVVGAAYTLVPTYYTYNGVQYKTEDAALKAAEEDTSSNTTTTAGGYRTDTNWIADNIEGLIADAGWVEYNYEGSKKLYVTDNQGTYGTCSDSGTTELTTLRTDGTKIYVDQGSDGTATKFIVVSATNGISGADAAKQLSGSKQYTAVNAGTKVIYNTSSKAIVKAGTGSNGYFDGDTFKGDNVETLFSGISGVITIGPSSNDFYLVNGVRKTKEEAQALAEASVTEAIKNASYTTASTFSGNPTGSYDGYNTESGYAYWVKISTKESTGTKDIDLVGDISIGRTKTSAKGNEVTLGVTLTNTDNANKGSYTDREDDVYIEPGERAVVSFADDASDEFTVEFGDDAYFVFNARGQGKLNLAYNTKYDRDFAYDYDDANIDFINFEGEPTTNRTGTLYIYADEDSYIYEVTSKGAKKINGAYYDDDEEAWVIRTRNLTSYAISDKKLKTVDQMNNGSSSSSKPGSNSGSGSNNGKPNPDTGR